MTSKLAHTASAISQYIRATLTRSDYEKRALSLIGVVIMLTALQWALDWLLNWGALHSFMIDVAAFAGRSLSLESAAGIAKMMAATSNALWSVAWVKKFVKFYKLVQAFGDGESGSMGRVRRFGLYSCCLLVCALAVYSLWATVTGF